MLVPLERRAGSIRATTAVVERGTQLTDAGDRGRTYDP
jgi:hypothetical protein